MEDHAHGERGPEPTPDPKAVLGDFSKPNPLVTFKPEDVDFIYGTKWKQRYWKKQGNDYFVLPAQWDVRNKVWRAYHVQPGTDWLVALPGGAGSASDGSAVRRLPIPVMIPTIPVSRSNLRLRPCAIMRSSFPMRECPFGC